MGARVPRPSGPSFVSSNRLRRLATDLQLIEELEFVVEHRDVVRPNPILAIRMILVELNSIRPELAEVVAERLK